LYFQLSPSPFAIRPFVHLSNRSVTTVNVHTPKQWKILESSDENDDEVAVDPRARAVIGQEVALVECIGPRAIARPMLSRARKTKLLANRRIGTTRVAMRTGTSPLLKHHGKKHTRKTLSYPLMITVT
jgi:hypothetical protein